MYKNVLLKQNSQNVKKHFFFFLSEGKKVNLLWNVILSEENVKV